MQKLATTKQKETWTWWRYQERATSFQILAVQGYTFLSISVLAREEQKKVKGFFYYQQHASRFFPD
jgi:hypothetical protein